MTAAPTATIIPSVVPTKSPLMVSEGLNDLTQFERPPSQRPEGPQIVDFQALYPKCVTTLSSSAYGFESSDPRPTRLVFALDDKKGAPNGAGQFGLLPGELEFPLQLTRHVHSV